MLAGSALLLLGYRLQVQVVPITKLSLIRLVFDENSDNHGKTERERERE